MLVYDLMNASLVSTANHWLAAFEKALAGRDDVLLRLRAAAMEYCVFCLTKKMGCARGRCSQRSTR